MTDNELKAAVLRLIKKKGFSEDLPASLTALGSNLNLKPSAAMQRSWATFVPGEIVAMWDELPEMFKLGVMAVACTDPMGCMSEND